MKITRNPRGSQSPRSRAFITLGLALTLGATCMNPAFATPAEDKLNQARLAESQVSDSVSAIENELAQVNASVKEAREAALVASDAYNNAMSNLMLAQRDSQQAQSDANKVKEKVDAARKDMATLARTVFTSQGSLSQITPYVKADGLKDVEMRKVAVTLFGAKADAQIKAFDDLSRVADAINKRAKEALSAAEAAAGEVQTQKAQADEVAAATEQKLAEATAKRDALVAKLAKARGVTLEAEKERQAEIEAEKQAREEAAQQEALRIALEKAQAEAAQQEAAKQQEAAQNNQNNAAPAPVEEAAPAPAPAVEESAPAPAPEADQNTGAAIVAYAKQFLGRPYVWAGNGPDVFDCSGLTSYVYRHFGINLPRLAEQQGQMGYRVSAAEAQPGDLVAYDHHIGIYIGNGYMIHAPQPGDVVRIAPTYGNPWFQRIL